jgi:hypothetical protein
VATPGALVREGVEGRLLVRVLAIAHGLAQLAGDRFAGREVAGSSALANQAEIAAS